MLLQIGDLGLDNVSVLDSLRHLCVRLSMHGLRQGGALLPSMVPQPPTG